VIYRPLCSYTQHHLRIVLSLAGRFCTAAIRELGLGNAVDDPAAFVDEVRRFNRRRSPKAVQLHLADVKEFFPNVTHEDLDRALANTEERLRKKNGSWKWF